MDRVKSWLLWAVCCGIVGGSFSAIYDSGIVAVEVLIIWLLGHYAIDESVGENGNI